jgi:hypothetical protein
VVGRGQRAHVILERKSVSHEHLSIQWTGEEVIVRDLGSSYGTFRMPQNAAFQEGNFPRKYSELALRLAKEDVTLSWEPIAAGVESTALVERTRAERTRLEKTSVESASSPVAPAVPSSPVATSPEAARHTTPLPASSPKSETKQPPAASGERELRESERGAHFAVLGASALAVGLSVGLASFSWGGGFVGKALFGSGTGALKDLVILWSGAMLAYGVLAVVLLLLFFVFSGLWAGAAAKAAPARWSVLGRAARVSPKVSRVLVAVFCLVALAWPFLWGLARGLPPSRFPEAFRFARVYLPTPEWKDFDAPTLAARIGVLRQMRQDWRGSSLLYKTLLEHQRTRILRECGGVGDRPWESKKICLVLLSAVAIETYGDIEPSWTAEIADRVALLFALDGVTRVISVEGVRSPFLPFFLDSLSSVGLEDEREDLMRLLADKELSPAMVRRILGELRRRIEVRLETRQRELRLSRPFRVDVPGPLESGI